MQKKKVFISHIAEEAKIANAFKELLEKSYLNVIEVFASSHEKSLTLGSDWLETVKRSIKTADVMIVLCSPLSVTRPWITFEAGAGWHKEIPVIPLCHSGLTPGKLPSPLNNLQGAILGDPDNIRKTFQIISAAADIDVPIIEATLLIDIVKDFENSVKASEYVAVVKFANSLLFQPVGSALFAIYASINKHEDIMHLKDGNLNYLTEPIHLNEISYIFNHSMSMVDLGQLRIFESFYNSIQELIEDVKFLMNYRHIDLTPELKSIFEQVFSLRSNSYLWIRPITMIADSENNIYLDYQDRIREYNGYEVSPEDQLYPYTLYLDSLRKVRNWIWQYSTIIDTILKVNNS